MLAHLTDQEQTDGLPGLDSSNAAGSARPTVEAVALSPEVETLLKELLPLIHPGSSLFDRIASALRASMAEAKDLRMSFEMASAALRASETAKQQAEQDGRLTAYALELERDHSARVTTMLRQAEASLAQREAEIARQVEQAFKAGYSDGQASVDKYGNTADETPDEAFAAYLKAQTGQQQKGQG